MSNIITTWLWGDTYSVRHVNTLYSMLTRTMSEPFHLVVVADGPLPDLDPGISVMQFDIPEWLVNLGGCYRRLVQFDSKLFDEWLMIDIDCVITDDLMPIIREMRQHDFSINRYCHPNARWKRRQYYNGALQWHTAQARSRVWRDFGEHVVPGIASDHKLVGTDQAWISHCLGRDEHTVGPEHGIYDVSQIDGLPVDARIVFFHGARCPSLSDTEWVREHYR